MKKNSVNVELMIKSLPNLILGKKYRMFDLSLIPTIKSFLNYYNNACIRIIL